MSFSYIKKWSLAGIGIVRVAVLVHFNIFGTIAIVVESDLKRISYTSVSMIPIPSYLYHAATF
jgi:hypothetical protein